MIKAFLRKVVPNSIWGAARVLRIKWRIARFPKRRVRHSYGGFSFEIEITDPLAEGWYDHDWPVLPEIAFLAKHRLREGARVFDLGSHQCIVALILARVVGEEGRVVALEANRHNADVGLRNRQLNRAEQLEVVHAAIAETSGRLIFNEGLNGQVDDGAGGWGRVEVPAITIDDLTTEFGIPDVLFIDVEGFECHALRGGHKTLATRPDCYVEVHTQVGLEVFGGSVNEVMSYFPAEHYERFIASPDKPEFSPFRDDSPLLVSRFFLVAIAKPKMNSPRGETP